MKWKRSCSRGKMRRVSLEEKGLSSRPSLDTHLVVEHQRGRAPSSLSPRLEQHAVARPPLQCLQAFLQDSLAVRGGRYLPSQREPSLSNQICSAGALAHDDGVRGRKAGFPQGGSLAWRRTFLPRLQNPVQEGAARFRDRACTRIWQGPWLESAPSAVDQAQLRGRRPVFERQVRQGIVNTIDACTSET